MATYSIRDLENISGIKAHTLRMWEQRYAILQPKRTETNIRCYDDEDLRLLLSISTLNCNGYKISAIARMSPAEIHEACTNLHTVCDEFAHQINALSLAMMEMDEAKLGRLIQGSVQRHGFEEAMLTIIYPFFERVGMLWQTGAITPLQEHFVSNIVRQKLIVAIDGQQPPRGENLPRYALFLPEHEYHELGLLFAAYLLRSRNAKVMYLGQSVPEEDLAQVHAVFQPHYFVTLITMAPPKETVQAYLKRLGRRFPRVQFLVGGAATQDLGATEDNVTVLPQPRELLRHLPST